MNDLLIIFIFCLIFLVVMSIVSFIKIKSFFMSLRINKKFSWEVKSSLVIILAMVTFKLSRFIEIILTFINKKIN